MLFNYKTRRGTPYILPTLYLMNQAKIAVEISIYIIHEESFQAKPALLYNTDLWYECKNR